MFGRKNVSISDTESETLKGFDDYDLRIGDILRGERATLGLSLADIEKSLKIKAEHLEAIENAEISAFAAPSFVPGYVRSYSRFLNLDSDMIFERFCRESGFQLATGIGTERKAAAPLNAATRSSAAKDPLLNSRTPFVPQSEPLLSRLQPGAIGSLLVLAAVIGGIGYGAWSALKEIQRVQMAPIEQTPDIATLDPVQSSTLSELVEPVDSASAVRFDRVYRPDALDIPVVESRDTPIASIDPGQTGALVAPDVQVAALVEERSETLTAPRVNEDRPAEVALMVIRPAWVRVMSTDGTRIFEKNMEAGEEFVLPATEESLSLRAGMAGYVYLRVGEKVYGPVGSGAQIANDVAISKQDVLQDFAEVDPSENAELSRAIAVAQAQP